MRLGCITPGKLLLTPNGKIGLCPPLVYRFVEGIGCYCYINPNPDAWDSDTIYQWGDCVSHNGQLWYNSWQGPNQGNEPGTQESGWVAYDVGTCINEDWDSIPPFGGFGKTPLYYSISVDLSGSKSYQQQFFPYHWYNSTVRFRAYFRAVVRSEDACEWVSGASYGAIGWIAKCRFEYSVEGVGSHGPWSQEGVLDQDDLDINASLTLCSGGDYGSLSIFLPIRSELCVGGGGDIRCYELPFYDRYIHYPDMPVCVLRDTINWSADWSEGSTIHTASGRISWRPLDCNYELWDPNKLYGVDACVAWEGRFYKSCQSNNQGHPPEEDASNVCEIGYWWRIV